MNTVPPVTEQEINALKKAEYKSDLEVVNLELEDIRRRELVLQGQKLTLEEQIREIGG